MLLMGEKSEETEKWSWSANMALHCLMLFGGVSLQPTTKPFRLENVTTLYNVNF